MHNLTMSCSLNELGPNRVPSPQVATNMQIQLLISVLSPSVRSFSTKVVTMDEVDMLVREENWLTKLMLGKREGGCDKKLR